MKTQSVSTHMNERPGFEKRSQFLISLKTATNCVVAHGCDRGALGIGCRNRNEAQSHHPNCSPFKIIRKADSFRWRFGNR